MATRAINGLALIGAISPQLKTGVAGPFIPPNSLHPFL